MDTRRLKAELNDYGFVVLKGLISKADAATAARRVVEIMKRQKDAKQPDQHLRGFFNFLEPTDDGLFVKLVTNPLCLELAEHLLGEGFQMTEVGCRWRKPGAPEGLVHIGVPVSDFPQRGLAIPNICFVVGMVWMLNDLTRDMGATLYLPFSQHAPYAPRSWTHYKYAVAVEAPAGSVVIHHGAVWHGFCANTTKSTARIGLMSGYFPYWLRPAVAGWKLMKRSVRDRMPELVRRMNTHVAED